MNGITYKDLRHALAVTPTYTSANDAIILARKHIGNNATMESSARVCLEDAVHQYDKGQYDAAIMWAAKSLSYSVGIAHADYRKVNHETLLYDL